MQRKCTEYEILATPHTRWGSDEESRNDGRRRLCFCEASARSPNRRHRRTLSAYPRHGRSMKNARRSSARAAQASGTSSAPACFRIRSFLVDTLEALLWLLGEEVEVKGCGWRYLCLFFRDFKIIGNKAPPLLKNQRFR